MINTEIPVKTYEQRVSEINSIEDIDRQLQLAKTTVTRLRNRGKSADTLAEKLAYNDAEKRAGAILRKLRHGSFDIEDELVAKAKALQQVSV
ncbi:MAG: hypothetical protein CL578_05720 [Alteromonadaceae bacterium]|uniref:Anti-sigma-28 factor FlgM C-terminal domain-containing protein n=1 Tax=Paraglaciecola agarilytica NO2 TaxID=1125747 RepID=A0ABQ0I1Z5_9ALTE|nr:hypothetical protein [Paraglaciecola agarilytica]MBN24530.1 hypothetical protein [Alteromonadaceae bacterium]GAC03336.1 hypothetical protein GAGA_0471 [Paraglaciecola agarilytica NO2]|tara:strand:+ start:27023 stop:27298 length:276 start_codon:yes stop_codon:yes gene_type:complete